MKYNLKMLIKDEKITLIFMEQHMVFKKTSRKTCLPEIANNKVKNIPHSQ